MRGMLIALTIAALGTTATFAREPDRPPTADERTRIEEVLRSLGYVSWEEIELDDGRWEIDNARTKDNVVYDLKLDPATMQVVNVDRE